MRILVTGGAGFIGSHFVEHLLKSTDWEVVVLDKLSYASSGLDRLREVTSSLDPKHIQDRLTILTADLSRPLPYGLKREIGDVDFIVHMAAETHVDNSISDPRPFVEANVMGTFEMLQFARELPSLRKFIYFSTDEVFGPAARGECDRAFGGERLEHFPSYKEWDRYNSTNPYSACKAAGEELCLAWANTFKVPMLITHTMNVFGERQHPEKYIPKCVAHILSGETLTIHADPSRAKAGSRFYIHARNVTQAVMFILGKCTTGNRDKFNIVGEIELSNLDLAQMIASILGKPLRYSLVDFHSSRPGHDLRYALDGSKMKNLGWKIPVPFIDSLTKTVNWMIQSDNIHWLLKKQQ